MPPRSRWILALSASCAVGLLAGCAGSDTVVAEPARSSPAVVVAVDATATPAGDRGTTAAPEADEERAMISFAVEGGFTNQIRSLDIDTDGTAHVEVSGRGADGRLDAARVEAIVRELDASGLFDRDRTYPAPEGADQQRFEIVYDGATLVAYDGTVPDELAEAVRLLEASLREAQR